MRAGGEQLLNSAIGGEVKVTTRNVYVNGSMFFAWGGIGGLPQIEKDYLYIGDQKLLLLNFTCRHAVYVRGTRHESERKCMIPVELEKESEADAVIKELTETWGQKFPLKGEEIK